MGGWEPRGTVSGTPEALLALKDAVYVALVERGVVESLDGGSTWRVVVRSLRDDGGT